MLIHFIDIIIIVVFLIGVFTFYAPGLEKWCRKQLDKID